MPVNEILLFVSPVSKYNYIVATSRESIRIDKLFPGTKVYSLGIASNDVAPGKILMEATNLSCYITILGNLKPFIDVEYPESPKQVTVCKFHRKAHVIVEVKKRGLDQWDENITACDISIIKVSSITGDPKELIDWVKDLKWCEECHKEFLKRVQESD